MYDSSPKTDEGSFPNIIFKKRLAPLPLFKQNIFNKTLTPSSSMDKTCFGFRSAGLPTTLPPGSPTKTFLNELKTINHYGRLCDQPFLEFSNFHFEQVFGSGSGKKKIVLEPVKQRKDKKCITKLYTIGDFNKSMRASTIKFEDGASKPGKQKKQKDKSKKENLSIIKKVYQIGEYETIVGFFSLEVVLVPVDGETSDQISLRIGKKELKRIYKKSHNEMAKAVLDSLMMDDDKLVANIAKDKSEKKSGVTASDQTYPDKRENMVVELNGQKYKATVHFPYLEVLIPDLDFKQKMLLKPINLSNLYEAKFANLDDYIQRFDLPPRVYKNKEDLRVEELKSLPTIIKKVIKTSDFGGLMLFKGLEVHLKNTSELQPETIMHESTLTPMSRNILRRKKKDVNNVLLRLNIYELDRTHKCTATELTELIKESLSIEDGEGFTINLPEEKTNAYHHRNQIKEDSLPEFSNKFDIRFNKFVYEGFVKFPTLELYVPETNFKDIIQLKPSQLKDLIDNSFKNMEDYMGLFKTPTTKRSLNNDPKIVLINPSESNEYQDIIQETVFLAKSSKHQTGIVNITSDNIRNLEALEENFKALESAQYIAIFGRSEADEEAEKIKEFFEAIKTAKGSQEVLKEKKVFFVQIANQSESFAEDEIKQNYNDVFDSLGLVSIKNLIIAEDDSNSRPRVKLIEERLLNLGKALETVKSIESIGEDFTQANKKIVEENEEDEEAGARSG